MKLARESTLILVILCVSDAIRDFVLVSSAKCIAMLPEFHGIVTELMPKFGVGRLVFWGDRLGGWRFSGGGGGGGGVSLCGGGRASCVLFLIIFYVY